MTKTQQYESASRYFCNINYAGELAALWTEADCNGADTCQEHGVSLLRNSGKRPSVLLADVTVSTFLTLADESGRIVEARVILGNTL